LIIDEISMSPPELFEKLNILGKLIREKKGAFGKLRIYSLYRSNGLTRITGIGGLQLIVSGDFFQLPPVPESKVAASCPRCGTSNFCADLRIAYVTELLPVVQVSRELSRYLLKKLDYLTKNALQEFLLQTSSSVLDRK